MSVCIIHELFHSCRFTTSSYVHTGKVMYCCQQAVIVAWLPVLLLLSLDLFCHLLLITCYNGSLPWFSDEVLFPFCMAFWQANAGSALLLSLLSGCSCQPDLKVSHAFCPEQHVASYSFHTNFHKPFYSNTATWYIYQQKLGLMWYLNKSGIEKLKLSLSRVPKLEQILFRHIFIFM